MDLRLPVRWVPVEFGAFNVDFFKVFDGFAFTQFVCAVVKQQCQKVRVYISYCRVPRNQVAVIRWNRKGWVKSRKSGFLVNLVVWLVDFYKPKSFFFRRNGGHVWNNVPIHSLSPCLNFFRMNLVRVFVIFIVFIFLPFLHVLVIFEDGSDSWSARSSERNMRWESIWVVIVLRTFDWLDRFCCYFFCWFFFFFLLRFLLRLGTTNATGIFFGSNFCWV